MKMSREMGVSKEMFCEVMNLNIDKMEDFEYNRIDGIYYAMRTYHLERNEMNTNTFLMKCLEYLLDNSKSIKMHRVEVEKSKDIIYDSLEINHNLVKENKRLIQENKKLRDTKKIEDGLNELYLK